MKFRKLACLVLACLLLAGCGAAQTAEGNMELALSAVVWQDYGVAYSQARAYLVRVPDNADAKVILETAAWGRIHTEEPELSLSKGTVTVDEFGIYVTDLPPVRKSALQLTGFWVGVDYDREEVRDALVDTHFLRSMTLYWTDEAGVAHAYEILYPERMTRKDLAASLLTQEYSGGTIDGQTREQLLELAEQQMAPVLKQLFKQIKKQTGMTPEELGFDAWNEK